MFSRVLLHEDIEIAKSIGKTDSNNKNHLTSAFGSESGGITKTRDAVTSVFEALLGGATTTIISDVAAFLRKKTIEMPTSSASPKVVASHIAVGLFSLMAAIQIAIAVGILPITIVWGASQHERTWQNSLASVMAAGILVGMAYTIHLRAKIPAQPSSCVRITSWMIAGYMVLNTLGNFLSTSWVERYLFGSMTVVLAICCFIVASSSADSEENNERNNYESIS